MNRFSHTQFVLAIEKRLGYTMKTSPKPTRHQLRMALSALGLTAKDCAESIGMHPQTVTRVLLGQTERGSTWRRIVGELQGLDIEFVETTSMVGVLVPKPEE